MVKRTAIGAVDEGVMETTIVRVEQLFNTSVARCQIRRNKRGFIPFRRIGKTDLKSVKALYGHFCNLDFAYGVRAAGASSERGPAQTSRAAGFRLGMYLHAFNIVQNPTAIFRFFASR